jgi:FkbM family methyltransferase
MTREMLDGMDQAGKDRWFERQWGGPPELKPRVYRNIQDKDCWYSVVVENEYRVPESFDEDDVIIDIGSHIGSFSWLAYQRGSRSVYAFEIDPWHVEIATVNLGGLQDGIGAYHAAIVRGDEHRAKTYHYTGAWNSFGQFGPQVPSKSLDEIIAEVGDIRFLKIDAEGAEWPALSTCTKLDRIQEIAGEYHILKPDGVPELQNLDIEISADGLKAFLESKGFAVEIVPKGENGGDGNFFAKRDHRVTYDIPTHHYEVPIVFDPEKMPEAVRDLFPHPQVESAQPKKFFGIPD